MDISTRARLTRRLANTVVATASLWAAAAFAAPAPVAPADKPAQPKPASVLPAKPHDVETQRYCEQTPFPTCNQLYLSCQLRILEWERRNEGCFGN